MGKKYYIPYIIYTACMYILPLSTIIFLILVSLLPAGASDNLIYICFWICIGGMAATFITGIPVVVMAIISIFKGLYNPVKITMVTKLLLIPAYIGNFIFYAVLIGGFLNPFLMLAVPLLLFLGICNTYAMMIASGLFELSYVIRKLIGRSFVFNFKNVAGVIFLFWFCLDVVGSIMLYTSLKNEE